MSWHVIHANIILVAGVRSMITGLTRPEGIRKRRGMIGGRICLAQRPRRVRNTLMPIRKGSTRSGKKR